MYLAFSVVRTISGISTENLAMGSHPCNQSGIAVRRQAKGDAALDGGTSVEIRREIEEKRRRAALAAALHVIYPRTIESRQAPDPSKSSSCFFTRLKHSGHMPCVNEAWERSIMYISISRQRPVSSLIFLQ